MLRAPDTPRPRQVVSTTGVSPAPPKSPVKEPTKERQRSNSGSNSVTSPPPNRKRTSSGVFQVDDSEPPQKKPEASRKRAEVNGKKSNETKKGKQAMDSEKLKTPEKKVIERFDDEAKTQCVSAFKESDSWD